MILPCNFYLYGLIQELKKAILEYVEVRKESGLHSFEQVTVTFSILDTMTLYVGMKIKTADSDPNLDSLSSTLWLADRLCTSRPPKACSKLTLQQPAISLKTLYAK